MANMSYCRFQNTLADLKDCYSDMDEPKNPDEQKAYWKLIKLCRDIADDYGDEYEMYLGRRRTSEDRKCKACGTNGDHYCPADVARD